MRVCADANFQTAVGRDAHGGQLMARHHGDTPAGVHRGTVRGLLAIHRHAHPNKAAVGLALFLAFTNGGQVDGFNRLAQCLGIVAAIKVFVGDVVERHLLGANQRLHAQFVGFNTGGVRQVVEQQFKCKTHTGSRHAPVRQNGAFVGGYRVRFAVVRREVVRAGQNTAHLAGFKARRERV